MPQQPESTTAPRLGNQRQGVLGPLHPHERLLMAMAMHQDRRGATAPSLRPDRAQPGVRRPPTA